MNYLNCNFKSASNLQTSYFPVQCKRQSYPPNRGLVAVWLTTALNNFRYFS